MRNCVSQDGLIEDIILASGCFGELCGDFVRGFHTGCNRALHPSRPRGSMLASKPDFAFAPANLRIPLLLVGMINDERTALVWIVDPGLSHHSFQVLAKSGMNFIHVGDELLDSLCFAELAEPAGIVFVAVRLQQTAFTRFPVGGMPYLEILIGGAEAIPALRLPNNGGSPEMWSVPPDRTAGHQPLCAFLTTIPA